MLFLLMACATTAKDTDAYNHPEVGAAASEFALLDVNQTSPSYDLDVAVSDQSGAVSAWYFGHSTWSYCSSQFGYLDDLQIATDAVIIGVNEEGYEAGNDDFTAGRDLPWLQETADESVWSLWDVEYRDVVILDADGNFRSVYNLTDNDLGDPDNQEILLSLFDAAR